MSTEYKLSSDAEIPAVYSWPELRKRWGRGLQFPDLDVDVMRHGETELNKADLVTGQLDIGLSLTGREQGRMLGAFLRPPYEAIFASTQRRSIETLCCALQARGLPERYESDSRLNERSLGVMEGKPRIFVPQFAAGELDFAPTEGESYRCVAQRCLSFLLDLHQRSQYWPADRRVLICSHMGPLRVLIAIWTGEHDAARMMAQEWKNALKFRLTVSAVKWPPFLSWRIVGSL
jgi:probable phosphoglycerate mutase